MRANHKLAMALLAGIALGISGATAMRAGQAKPAPGYMIAEVEVTDPAGMRQYGQKVPETLSPFPHQYVVRGGKTIPLEGEPPKGIVIIQFDSLEQAKAWYDSPAYAEVKPLRLAAAKSRAFLAEGPAPQ